MGYLVDEGLVFCVVFVGDVMIDVCLQVCDFVFVNLCLVFGVEVGEEYVMVMIYCVDNIDDFKCLVYIFDVFGSLDCKVILLVYLCLCVCVEFDGFIVVCGNFIIIDLLVYFDMVNVVINVVGVIIDLGGL